MCARAGLSVRFFFSRTKAVLSCPAAAERVPPARCAQCAPCIRVRAVVCGRVPPVARGHWTPPCPCVSSPGVMSCSTAQTPGLNSAGRVACAARRRHPLRRSCCHHFHCSVCLWFLQFPIVGICLCVYAYLHVRVHVCVPPPPVLTRACSNTAAPFSRIFGLSLKPSFSRLQSNRNCGLWLCAGCRKCQYGCQSVGGAVIPCALVFRGMPACWTPFL